MDDNIPRRRQGKGEKNKRQQQKRERKDDLELGGAVLINFNSILGKNKQQQKEAADTAAAVRLVTPRDVFGPVHAAQEIICWSDLEWMRRRMRRPKTKVKSWNKKNKEETEEVSSSGSNSNSNSSFN